MTPRWFTSALLVAAGLVGSATSTRADSDGYFCTGLNYIAYQLSLSLRTGRHTLYVVLLSDSAGIGRPDSIELSEFQVHGMRCDTSSVELLGWDSLYTVRLRDARPSPLARVAPWADQGASRRVPPAYLLSNLGGWSSAAKSGRSGLVPLQMDGATHRFALAMDVTSEPKNPCVHTMRTRIVQLDMAQRPIHALTVFHGTVPSECGE